MEIELDRVRGVMIQQDRTIDARERAHHARISILEDTVSDMLNSLKSSSFHFFSVKICEKRQTEHPERIGKSSVKQPNFYLT